MFFTRYQGRKIQSIPASRRTRSWRLTMCCCSCFYSGPMQPARQTKPASTSLVAGIRGQHRSIYNYRPQVFYQSFNLCPAPHQTEEDIRAMSACTLERVQFSLFFFEKNKYGPTGALKDEMPGY